jgi:hypothetical protein
MLPGVIGKSLSTLAGAPEIGEKERLDIDLCSFVLPRKSQSSLYDGGGGGEVQRPGNRRLLLPRDTTMRFPPPTANVWESLHQAAFVLSV